MTLTPLEIAALERIRRGGGSPPPTPAPGDEWLAFGLTALFDICRLLRSGRREMVLRSTDRKSDGTPTTPLERDVEERIRARLTAFMPGTALVGEETGGEMLASGTTVAVDPVDGTWAFLNGTEQFSSTLAVFRDGVPFLGLVASPSTGELAYGGEGVPSRILRLSVFGEADQGDPLPLQTGDGPILLVNLHPSRAAPSVVEDLHRAWSAADIRALRSPGGSPAWGMIEVAKGRYTYVNLWTTRAAEPFDLAAPALVVRSAGGEVIDLDGNPIDAVRHAGPFVAGLDAGHREVVAGIVARALTRSEGVVPAADG